MKKILLIFTLMISVTVFSQPNEKEFLQNRKHVNEPRLDQKFQNFNDWEWRSREIQSQFLLKKPTANVPLNAPNAMKQQLDSVKWNDKYDTKVVFKYDNRGNTTSLELFDRGYTHYKYEYEYNFKNQVIVEKNNYFDQKKEYEYDNNGYLKTRKIYYWLEEEWQLVSKIETTCDEKGNIIFEIEHNWEDGNWQLWSKYEAVYDQYDNRTSSSHYYYLGKGEWDLISQGTAQYTYDSRGNVLLLMYQAFDNSLWLEWKYKIENTYLADDKLSVEVRTDWNFDNNEWYAPKTTEYEYDDNGNIKKYGNTNLYNEYDYNYSFAKKDLVTPIQHTIGGWWTVLVIWLFPHEMNNMRTGEKEYQYNGNIYEQTASIDYYWSAQQIGINENFQTTSLSLYPNPVSNILHIETGNGNILPEVNIYSIQGVLLIHAKDNQIDVSSLPNGIYIAKIDGVYRKIVKHS